MTGPLRGLRVIELAGLGPGPFAGMMLADAGAEVVLIDRPGATERDRERRRHELMHRGKRSLVLDFKHPQGRALLLDMLAHVDALIEGFRPGVMERIGLGPDECMGRNERLVYGRMTGWGQEGPLARVAGHDINFIGLTGALHAIGERDAPPVPPLNLVGDFGGGGMLLAFGLICALLEADRSGRGQVVDAAMVDGASILTSFIHGLRHMGHWDDQRASNLVDGGAHFYGTYETADGKYIAVGAVEPRFYAELLDLIGIPPSELAPRMDRRVWPEARARLACAFRSKTRDEWCAIFEGTDACVSPVLSFEEAPHHRHNVWRSSFLESEGAWQPAPAPRFGRTPGAVDRPPPLIGEHADEVLKMFGIAAPTVSRLRDGGVIG